MKKNPKFIYFDVGGVLMNWSRSHEQVAAKYNVTVTDISAIIEANWQDACRGKSTTHYMASLASLLKLSQPLPELSDFWTDHYTPIAQTHALIHELHKTHKLGLLTNAERMARRHAMRKGLIPDITWSAIIDSSEHHTIKPEPKIYEIAEMKAMVNPDELLFIDDRPENIEAAILRGWEGEIFDEADIPGSIQRIRNRLK